MSEQHAIAAALLASLLGALVYFLGYQHARIMEARRKIKALDRMELEPGWSSRAEWCEGCFDMFSWMDGEERKP